MLRYINFCNTYIYNVYLINYPLSQPQKSLDKEIRSRPDRKQISSASPNTPSSKDDPHLKYIQLFFKEKGIKHHYGHAPSTMPSHATGDHLPSIQKINNKIKQTLKKHQASLDSRPHPRCHHMQEETTTSELKLHL